LTMLDLSGTRVQNVEPLLRMSHLKRLSLRNTPISEEDAVKLKMALHDCQIDFGDIPAG